MTSHDKSIKNAKARMARNGPAWIGYDAEQASQRKALVLAQVESLRSRDPRWLPLTRVLARMLRETG